MPNCRPPLPPYDKCVNASLTSNPGRRDCGHAARHRQKRTIQKPVQAQDQSGHRVRHAGQERESSELLRRRLVQSNVRPLVQVAGEEVQPDSGDRTEARYVHRCLGYRWLRNF